MWRFESVHSFASVGNLYQKMHFAGSNLSTDPKCPKCIYKISKNFRVEKSGEISRNLRFSRFFVPASKSDTHDGWDSWTRTSDAGVKVLCLDRLGDIPSLRGIIPHSSPLCQGRRVDFPFIDRGESIWYNNHDSEMLSHSVYYLEDWLWH